MQFVFSGTYLEPASFLGKLVAGLFRIVPFFRKNVKYFFSVIAVVIVWTLEHKRLIFIL